MPKRLTDLRKRGMPYTFTDTGDGEPVTVWIAKIGGDDHDTCVKKGRAARARVLREFKDEDSDAYLEAYDWVADLGPDGQRMLLAADERRKITDVVEARFLGDEDSEWAKDGYLDGLREAWLGDGDEAGLSRAYAVDPEHPEAKRVWEEMSRFLAAVDERVTVELARFEEGLAERPDDDIFEEVLALRQLQVATHAWVAEYDRWEIRFAVRELHDHRQYHFKTMDEVGDLDDSVLDELQAVISALRVDPVEGKDLPPDPTSSPPSPSPEQPVLAAVSGPTAADT